MRSNSILHKLVTSYIELKANSSSAHLELIGNTTLLNVLCMQSKINILCTFYLLFMNFHSYY